MSNNNNAQKHVHEIQLRSKATTIRVEGVDLQCEYTREIEGTLTRNFREIAECQKKVPKIQDAINGIIGHNDIADIPEESITEVENLRKEMDELYKSEVSILKDMAHSIFIGDDAEKAIDVCKDSRGEINPVTLAELINIVLDYLTSKVNTSLKDKNAKYKKHRR